MPIVHATLDNARVLIRHNRLVLHSLALDVTAMLRQLRDLMAAPVVDKYLAEAHLMMPWCAGGCRVTPAQLWGQDNNGQNNKLLTTEC
jgi:hypothetical protein